MNKHEIIGILKSGPKGVFRNPSYTPGSLFLTPRAPNGKRLPARARHRHHMRGSEDGYDKHGLSGKEQQGIGGAMMPNQFGGTSGKPTQTGGSSNNAFKVPHTDPGDYHVSTPPVVQPPQEGPLSKANQERARSATAQAWASGSSTPFTFGNGDGQQHVEGNVSAEGENGLRLGSVEGDFGFSLPRSANTYYDRIPRGIPPETKKRSGKPLFQFDKRVPQYYKDTPDEGYPRSNQYVPPAFSIPPVPPAPFYPSSAPTYLQPTMPSR